MTRRPGPTPATTDQISGRLHIQPHFAVHQLLGADHELGQPHQDSGTAATLDHGQGSLLLQTFNPQNGETLARVDGFPNQTR